MAEVPQGERINLERPRYDQSSYMGRAKHFLVVTNPLNLFCSGKELDAAKELVVAYRNRTEPLGTTPDQLWKAKSVYDSAFHPDTGEKMFIAGRMSAQVPCNMSITGCMMAFRTSTSAVVFWQWLNQSFNAVVNHTNRSGSSEITTKQLGISYLLATGAATGTALGLNRIVVKLPDIAGRYVPFAAVAAANCINIPFMRSKEIIEGIPVETEAGECLGQSSTAAKKGIAQVVFSRIVMATPGMAIPPLIMQQLEKGAFLKKYPKMNAPMTVGIVGFMLIFATPLCCAIFPQRSSISVSSLEKDLQEEIHKKYPALDRVYFNKGL